jgi:hypothetical protein
MKLPLTILHSILIHLPCISPNIWEKTTGDLEFPKTRKNNSSFCKFKHCHCTNSKVRRIWNVHKDNTYWSISSFDGVMTHPLTWLYVRDGSFVDGWLQGSSHARPLAGGCEDRLRWLIQRHGVTVEHLDDAGHGWPELRVILDSEEANLDAP